MNKKICNVCEEEKILDDFHKDKTKSLGVSNKCKKCRKEYVIKNKKKYNFLAKNDRIKNKIKKAEYSKNYYLKNKKYLKEYGKKYRQENKDKFKKYAEKRKSAVNENLKNKRKSDPLFKLKGTLRNRIYTMFKFKNWKKNKHTEEILGASYEKVKLHIESTFVEGMSWDNHGDWHIDHKTPLSSANSEENLYRLCHYTNLQALWASDNISKSNKV